MWNLRAYAKKHHQITNAVQLQAFIKENLGVIVTVQILRALLRSQPPAPRGVIIQLLCDAFNCCSDAFYRFKPNPVRAQRWAKDRSEGKEPSPLYQPKAAEPLDEVIKVPETTAQSNSTGKPKSLRATFSDPRALLQDRLRSKK